MFENELFQLIQYDPATDKVAAEPLLYVPPLVNRYYMIDLVPRQSLVKWLVDEGRTVFVISWVNPGAELKDKDVGDYVLSGVVEAIGEVRKRAGQCARSVLLLPRRHARGDRARLAGGEGARRRGQFGDADRLAGRFLRHARLVGVRRRSPGRRAGTASRDARASPTASKLQRLFAAMRANDLIWSSVVNHYLLDREAPPSDLLYWFEDGARIPAAFLKSYNRELLLENRLKEPAGFKVGDVAIDLAAITTPMLVIALKDDHVSAWEAVYAGARHLGADFILGGSGHNAGNRQPAGREQARLLDQRRPARRCRSSGSRTASRHEGSWWPWWTEWLDEHGKGKTVRCAQAQGPDRARARPLRDDAVMDAMTAAQGRDHREAGPRRAPAAQPSQGAA